MWTSNSHGVTTSDSERAQARQWTAANLEGIPSATEPFLSFAYGERNSTELLSTWHVERAVRQSDQGAREHTVTYLDPKTGLEVRCVALEYADFPAVEWVLYFKNTGTSATPILQDIRAIDAGLPLLREKAARVHYANGSECRLDDFAPLVESLGPNEQDPQGVWRGEENPLRLESKGGRSSCGRLPFFNLDMDTHGVMAAIGWTGDWYANLYRTDSEVRLEGGMKRTHLKLLPGEEIRSPRILLLFWEGERLRGHNLLRQFILAHHSPQQNGRRAQAPVSLATWGGNFAAKHIEHGQWLKDNNLSLDYLWVDAGWFGNDEAKEGANVFNSRWGIYVGDWHANPGYFPNGLQQLGTALKNLGMGFLLWLEPERVFKGTTWTRDHPEFLSGPIGENFLFNLGDPAARKMLADHLSNLIRESGIGCYRQDFNMDPRPFWDAADAPDRVGMSEIRHITGLYALWDDLLSRFPNLLIDNCSSGGRRIDLETISRSIPLWRSDVQCFPNFGTAAMQGQNYGLGLWTPLSVGCCDREDSYVFRSALGPGMVLIMYEFEKDTQKHFSLDWLRAMLDQLNGVRPYFLGDFYPLVSFSLADDGWSAWQYDRPDLGEGMVLALRRPESPFSLMMPRLRGLKPDSQYELRDLDSGGVIQRAGRDLCETGLQLEISQRPGSRLITYKKI
jgi:alpha-galactosidase